MPLTSEGDRGRRRPTSFRRRLLLTFLVLGIAPVAILTLLTWRQFGTLAQLWQNPALGTLIENAVDLARLSLAPVELDATALARRIVEDEGLAAALRTGDLARAEAEVRDHLAHDAGGPAGTERFAALRTTADGETRPWYPVGAAPVLGNARRLPPAGSPAVEPKLGVVWCRLALPAESGVAAEVLAGYTLTGAIAAGARNLDEALPLYRSLGTYERVRIRFFWAVVVTLFITLVVASWVSAQLLARSLAQPILDLEEGTRRIASGDYSHRVAPRRRDELGRLVEAFNRMSGDLEDRTEKLRRAERVAAWRDVARGLAHQIKNPLTPIRISSHRLRSLPHPPGSRERGLLDDCLGTLDHEVATLERIADEFSRFARLPEPRLVPLDAGALAREVAGLYAGAHPGVRLTTEIDPDLPLVPLDADLTRQAISNLVKNAVEAMNGRGDLTVRVQPLAGPGVRIQVSDTGPGIPAELRERLFTPYLTTKSGGTGLGLALSHRMVADQGGSLEVLTGAGPGTTFQMDFPGRSTAGHHTDRREA